MNEEFPIDQQVAVANRVESLKKLRLQVSLAFLSRETLEISANGSVIDHELESEIQARKNTKQSEVVKHNTIFGPSYVFVQSPTDYKQLLTFAYETLAAHTSFPSERITASVESDFRHELDHAKLAITKGAKVMYGVRFVQFSNTGKLALQPLVRVMGNIKRSDLDQITSAPANLSETDTRKLRD